VQAHVKTVAQTTFNENKTNLRIEVWRWKETKWNKKKLE
jgi:hypothetical protein